MATLPIPMPTPESPTSPIPFSPNSLGLRSALDLGSPSSLPPHEPLTSPAGGLPFSPNYSPGLLSSPPSPTSTTPASEIWRCTLQKVKRRKRGSEDEAEEVRDYAEGGRWICVRLCGQIPLPRGCYPIRYVRNDSTPDEDAKTCTTTTVLVFISGNTHCVHPSAFCDGNKKELVWEQGEAGEKGYGQDLQLKLNCTKTCISHNAAVGVWIVSEEGKAYILSEAMYIHLRPSQGKKSTPYLGLTKIVTSHPERWWASLMDSTRAKALLDKAKFTGSYLMRISPSQGRFVISLYYSHPDEVSQVHHIVVNQTFHHNQRMRLYLSGASQRQYFDTLAELELHYRSLGEVPRDGTDGVLPFKEPIYETLQRQSASMNC